MPKILFLLLMTLLFINPQNKLPDSDHARKVRMGVWPKLSTELKNAGFKANSPIYIRLFKDEKDLEIWVKAGTQFKFFKSYNICTFTGGLGTKVKEGDYKSPEGFYTITPGQLNPVSHYDLAINVGYPNKLEKLKGYTGNSVMIHGSCLSAGCYAMGDAGIEDIYTLVYKALDAGQQQIDVDIFPFRMSDALMKSYASNPNIVFWKTLKPGYDLFQKYHQPPAASIVNKEYHF